MNATTMRHHFVFLKPCGCPIGLTRAEDRAARARGVHVDHPTYTRDFYPLMTAACPHG